MVKVFEVKRRVRCHEQSNILVISNYISGMRNFKRWTDIIEIEYLEYSSKQEMIFSIKYIGIQSSKKIRNINTSTSFINNNIKK